VLIPIVVVEGVVEVKLVVDIVGVVADVDGVGAVLTGLVVFITETIASHK